MREPGIVLSIAARQREDVHRFIRKIFLSDKSDGAGTIQHAQHSGTVASHVPREGSAIDTTDSVCPELKDPAAIIVEPSVIDETALVARYNSI